MNESLTGWLERMTTMLDQVVQEVPENPFSPGDRVVVTEKLPNLAGETGTVRDPDYMGYVMVSLDGDKQKLPVEPFLSEELKQVEETR